MNISSFPVRQGELIKQVRGTLSQAEFARQLQVSRSCLSRYESEKLGAPTAVINHCLGAIAAQLSGLIADGDPLQRALQLSRDTTRQLEQVTLHRSG
jgi:DNA-binding XRE family transcriptional regulator